MAALLDFKYNMLFNRAICTKYMYFRLLLRYNFLLRWDLPAVS